MIDIVPIYSGYLSMWSYILSKSNDSHILGIYMRSCVLYINEMEILNVDCF